MITQRAPPVFFRLLHKTGTKRVQVNICQTVYQGIPVIHYHALEPLRPEKPLTSVTPVVEPRKPLLDLLYVFRKTRPFLPEIGNLSILEHLCTVFAIVQSKPLLDIFL